MSCTKETDTIAQYQVAYRYANGEGVQQDYVEARKWYQKAMDNGMAWAYNNMAYLYAEGNGVAKDIDRAIALINKAIEISPNELHFYDSLGEMYSILGDQKKAKDIWRRIIKKDPSFAEQNTAFVKYINNLK